MRQTSIKDILTEKISGEWGNAAADDNGVVVIRTANFLNTGKINFSNLVRRQIELKKVEKKKLISGDIIIEKSGGSPTQPVGRVVFFENPDGDTYLCNNFTTILRPNKELVCPEFLFYVLHSNHKKGKTLRHQNKTTGIINLKLDSYLASEIILPPLNDQIRIAHLLGKVEGLIAQRKQHLQHLDNLLKSVFLEMFGDPVRNDKGWMKRPLSELATVRIGPFGSLLHAEDYISGGIPLINPSHMVNGEIAIDESLTITEEKYHELSTYHLALNDVVVARRGEIGRCALVRSKTKLLCGTGSMLVRVTGEYLPIMLQFMIYRTTLKNYLESQAKGVTMKNLNSSILEKMQVIVPPIDFQNQFATIVEKIQALKFCYQQNLTDLEALYGALSQQAFKGELDLSRVPIPTQHIINVSIGD